MRKLRERVFNHRVLALMTKEFGQIRRDRRLAMSLVMPPILQLTLLGFALSATVTNVPLGILDDSRTPESRELIAALTESRSFRLAGYFDSPNLLGNAITEGRVSAGVVIPYEYGRNLQRGIPTTVQFLVNAMDANTARISQSYAQGVIQQYNAGLRAAGAHANFQQIAAPRQSRRGTVQLFPAFLYNPGLVDSWFIVTGVFGLLLMLNSSLVSAAAMVREREMGTIEQLLMSPANTSEIIFAKMAPLFVLLSLMMLLAIATLKLVFHVPSRGSWALIIMAGALCILAGISLGTVVSTLSKSAIQAQLTMFFINPPLNSLAGALSPVEAMPRWLQPVTVLNPIHHFATIVRAVMMKGSGLAAVWPNLLGLAIFALVLFVLSVWRFRKQLS